MKKSLCIILTLISMVCHADLPEPDLPAGIKGNWVAQKMEFNGLPMNIRSFHSILTTDQLASIIPEYLNQFGEKLHSFKDKEGWQTYSTKGKNTFYSVKVRNLNVGAEGIMTISGTKKTTQKRTKQLPFGVSKVQTQKFFDGATIQEFSIYSSRFSVPETKVHIERIMANEGWSTTRQYTDAEQHFVRNKERARTFIEQNSNAPGTLVLVSKEYSH